MIPKIIHYCWFGKKPLSETAKKNIEGWKSFFPDYEIIMWNEDNFDISRYPFAAQAYSAGKWAFVSDVARLSVIYQYGGVYFDTDVEVVRAFDDIIIENTKGFMGFEKTGKVNTGLGFGAEKNHPAVKLMLDAYERINLDEYIDNLDLIACPVITTRILLEKGLSMNKRHQVVCGLDVYSPEYFSPLDYNTGTLNISKDTHSIHWYDASWQDDLTRKRREKIRWFRRHFGMRIGDKLFGICSCVKQEGLFQYCRRHIGL